MKLAEHRKSAGFFEERGSLNSQTSQYSSQVSLTHGAYVLDSVHNLPANEYPAMKRFCNS